MIKLLPEYDKDDVTLHQVAVSGHGRWQKNDMDRMYINTSDRSLRVFYDLKAHVWESSDPTLDLENLKRNVYDSVGASSDADFEDAMRRSGWI